VFDVVILENIDCFFTHEKQSQVVLMRDFNLTTQGFNSSVMRFNNEVMTPNVWLPYLKEKKRFSKLQGDQNVITDLVDKKPLVKNVKIFDDIWTQSYKWLDRSQTRFHKNSWTFEQSKNAKVAIFHGNPKPHESDQEWVKFNWK
jgi:hypothetical protein